MVRILMRAGKSPLSQIDPVTTIKKNLIANNTGNLLFAQSVFKALFTADNEIDVAGYSPAALSAGEINEKYDFFVLPLANSFRGSFKEHLRAYTKLIRQLRIPVVVVGVGAQTDLNHSQLRGSPVDDATKEFVAAVLDRSHSIGVRGDYTRTYLNKLGFSAVETIGCPSMYLNGSRLKVEKKVRRLSKDNLIAFNITPGMPTSVSALFRSAYETYPNSIYVPQDMGDALLMMGGKPRRKIAPHEALPSSLDDSMMKDGRTVMFTDVQTWIDFMRGCHFSFGTRIHGNVFALLAGTPTTVIAHDSRTLEIAQYYEIPYIKSDQITEATSVASLYEDADFGPMLRGHAARFAKFKAFLERNGLPHAYRNDPDQNEVFDQRVQASGINGVIKVQKLVPPRSLARERNDLGADGGTDAHLSIRRFVENNLSIAQEAARARLRWIKANRDGANAPRPRIFIYWAQGFENAPAVVRACKREVLKHHGADDVMFLDDDNIRFFVDCPREIMSGIFQNKTAFSDYLRFELLSRYGGVWQDATCLSTGNSFSVFPMVGNTNSCGAFGKSTPGVFSSWFIASSHKSYATLLMREMITAYFVKNAAPEHYFAMHQIFRECYLRDDLFRQSVIDLGASGLKPRAMNRSMLKPVSRADFARMKADSFIHKLSWKHKPEQITSKMLISQVVRGDDLWHRGTAIPETL